jgi:hypothetical protein
MSGQLQLRRGTTAQNSTFTGAVGELIYNTDDGSLISHNGVTAGGYPGGGYLYAPGATVRNVKGKLQESVSVKDFGAVGNGVANDTAAFTAAGSIAARVQVLIPAGIYKLNSNPTPTGFVTWVIQQGASFTGAGKLPYGGTSGNILAASKTFESIENDPAFYNGIFGYLEDNAALTGYGVIGLHGSVKSSDSTGAAGTARIGVAAFGVNDFVGGAAGVWGLYSTVVRKATSTGFTQGMELDVANFGPQITLYPSTPFLAGLTAGIWCCTGGETTEPSAGGSPGVASVGLAIIQNDTQAVKTAKFDKGIMFHNAAINGADGTGGANVGIAIAFATGHSMIWFNNSNQATAEITNSGATFASTNMRLDFSNSGVLIQDRSTGRNAFSIQKTANFKNGISILPGLAGTPARIQAIGETNLNLVLEPKGTGVVQFGTHTGTADTAISGYIEIKDAGGTTRKLAIIT